LTPIETGSIKEKEEGQSMHNRIYRVATNSRTNEKRNMASTCTLIWTSCASPNSIPENSLEQPGFACKRQFRGENL